jgi:uncharacterized protein with HEPN domain
MLLATAALLSAKVADNSPLTTAGEDVRLAVQRLVIALGEEIKRLRDARMVDARVEPWEAWAEVRNLAAHTHPSEVDDARLWRMAAADVPVLVSAVHRVMRDPAHPSEE